MFKFLFQNKLPDERENQEKIIFVISSSNLARIFIVENRDINELTPLSIDKIDNKDKEKEWFTFTNNSSSVATNVWFKETKKTHDDSIFVKLVIEEIQRIDQKYQAHKIIIHSPEGFNRLYSEGFSNIHEDKVIVHVGNHINISFPKIFDLLKK